MQTGFRSDHTLKALPVTLSLPGSGVQVDERSREVVAQDS